MHTWRKNLVINSRFARAEGWPRRGMRKRSNSSSFIIHKGMKVHINSAAVTPLSRTWTVHFPSEDLEALYSWALHNKLWHFKNRRAMTKTKQNKTNTEKKKPAWGLRKRHVKQGWSFIWLLLNNSVTCSHSHKWRPFVFRDLSVTLLLLHLSKHMDFICIEFGKAQIQMLCI